VSYVRLRSELDSSLVRHSVLRVHISLTRVQVWNCQWVVVIWRSGTAAFSGVRCRWRFWLWREHSNV